MNVMLYLALLQEPMLIPERRIQKRKPAFPFKPAKISKHEVDLLPDGLEIPEIVWTNFGSEK